MFVLMPVTQRWGWTFSRESLRYTHRNTHTHLVFSGPLKVTPAVFSQFHPEQSRPSITEELRCSPKLPRVNPLIAVADDQVLKRLKTRFGSPSFSGRERTKGGEEEGRWRKGGKGKCVHVSVCV